MRGIRAYAHGGHDRRMTRLIDGRLRSEGIFGAHNNPFALITLACLACVVVPLLTRAICPPLRIRQETFDNAGIRFTQHHSAPSLTFHF